MAHFAKIENNIVTQVIVAEQDFINTLPGTWLQTSYNTLAGEHKSGDTPLRKNYAGIGYTYNKTLDAFIPPKTYDSWVLNVNTCQWDAPVPYPTDGKEYSWDEKTKSWALYTPKT